jgi:hypothetical protein
MEGVMDQGAIDGAIREKLNERWMRKQAMDQGAIK